MIITVRLFAIFRERLGRGTLEVPMAGGATVGAVWERVVADHPDLQPLRAVTRFARNGTYATPDTPIHDGDEVAFLPPMSGGCGGCA